MLQSPPVTAICRRILPRALVIAILVAASLFAVFVDVNGNGRTLDPLANAGPVVPNEPTAVRRRSTVSTATDEGMQLLWQPGGVVGHSHAQALAKMQRITASVLTSVLGSRPQPRDASSAASNPSSDMCNVANDVKQLGLLLVHLTDAMVAHAVDEADECLYHIAPHHRAICSMLYEMDSLADAEQALAASVRNGSVKVGSLWQGTFQQSLCANFMTCMGWASGRLQVIDDDGDGTPQNVSAALLDRVFERHVRPVLERRRTSSEDTSSFVSSGLLKASLLDNFMHGEGNWNVLKHLSGRHAAMRLDIYKRDRITDWKLEQAPRKRIAISGPASRMKGAWRRSTPVADILQGAVIDFDTVREQWAVAQKDDPAAKFLPSFSPLALLAILRRVAQHGTPLNDNNGSTLGLVIFHGDSTVRELYHRLIHHLRYGLATQLNDAVVLEANGAAPKRSAEHILRIRRPFYDYTYHGDSVYSVFETHDTLTLFNDKTNRASGYSSDSAARGDVNGTDAASTAATTTGDSDATGGIDASTSPPPPPTATGTATSNAPQDVVAYLQRLREQGNRDTHGAQALLHIVFLWDTHSRRYRNDPLVHVRGLPNSGRGRWNQSTLREEGFGIGLHVQGATQWESQRDPDMMLHWAAMATAVHDEMPSLQFPPSTGVVGDDRMPNDGVLRMDGLENDLAIALRNVTIDGAPTERDATLVYMMSASLQDKLAQTRNQHLAPQHVYRGMPKPFPYTSVHPDHNETLVKNELHLKWLRQVDQMRRAARNTTDAGYRFVRSIKVLDKAKLPYLPSIRSYDRFHLSCRCDKIFFDNFFRPTITKARMYLLTASLLHPTLGFSTVPPSPTNATAAANGGGDAAVAEYDVCQAPDAPLRVGRHALLELIRKAEWVLARKRSYYHRVMLRAAHRGSNGLPFHHGKDYCGVVDSMDGCADHGDFGLLQLLAFDVGAKCLLR